MYNDNVNNAINKVTSVAKAWSASKIILENISNIPTFANDPCLQDIFYEHISGASKQITTTLDGLSHEDKCSVICEINNKTHGLIIQSTLEDTWDEKCSRAMSEYQMIVNAENEIPNTIAFYNQLRHQRNHSMAQQKSATTPSQIISASAATLHSAEKIAEVMTDVPEIASNQALQQEFLGEQGLAIVSIFNTLQTMSDTERFDYIGGIMSNRECLALESSATGGHNYLTDKITLYDKIINLNNQFNLYTLYNDVTGEIDTTVISEMPEEQIDSFISYMYSQDARFQSGIETDAFVSPEICENLGTMIEVTNKVKLENAQPLPEEIAETDSSLTE